MKNKTLKKKKNRIFNIILVSIFIILLILVSINYILSKFVQDYQPNIFGYKFLIVVTDSMEPTIEVGSLTSSKLLSHKDKETLKKGESIDKLQFGDIIVFEAYNNKLGKNILITHYFDRIEDGIVYTYGEQFDENDTRIICKSQEDIISYDGYQDSLTIDNIISVYEWHIEDVGTYIYYLKTDTALIIYCIIGVSIIGLFLISCLCSKKKKEKITEKPNQNE